MEKKVSGSRDPAAATDSNGAGGANVSRKLSKRQQEKAPEGHGPRGGIEEEVAKSPSGGSPRQAPVESKFTEAI